MNQRSGDMYSDDSREHDRRREMHATQDPVSDEIGRQWIGQFKQPKYGGWDSYWSRRRHQPA